MDYIVQKESLESVADSIRAKAGISEKLVFPDGWKAAVEGIQTGGGGVPLQVAEASLTDECEWFKTGMDISSRSELYEEVEG